MVSDNGVSNSKDLKGPLTKITDSTSYPKTPYYMDKSTDRENSVTKVKDQYTITPQIIKKCYDHESIIMQRTIKMLS